MYMPSVALAAVVAGLVGGARCVAAAGTPRPSDAATRSSATAQASTQQAEKYLAAGVQAYRRGRAGFDAELLAKAKKYLAHAVELRPSPEGYFFLAGTLALLSKPRTAIRAYLASLRLDPKAPSAHQNVAQLFDELGNRSAAVAHYHRWAELAPSSASARRAFAMSLLWSRKSVHKGAELCLEAVELAPQDPDVPFDCAQSLTLLMPPKSREQIEDPSGDASGAHYSTWILPLFNKAQRLAFARWRGGAALDLGPGASQWARPSPAAPSIACPEGARAVRDWSEDPLSDVEDLTLGGDVYGEQVPHTFGGPFSWAGQRYVERGVRIATLRNVILSGNEGVITRGCDVFVPYYDAQVPWHENLPPGAVPEAPVRILDAALWLLVMFPANFFSFLVDELARLAVWLCSRRQRLPLLVPADRGMLKGFMHDWFTLLGGFQVIPYDVRPHFVGAARVAEPRFAVRELHVVDWRDPPGAARRGDVFLLPPRWALEQLRALFIDRVIGSKLEGRRSKLTSVRKLLWIRRATATTRRVVNEDELFDALTQLLVGVAGLSWRFTVFSDEPPAPTARETVQMFHDADLVVGFHGSGQANQVFCRPGTGIIDINLPEPHSQYTAHNSYALGLRYRLVMMQGVALHQAVNVTIPVHAVVEAVKSLLAEPRFPPSEG